MDKNGFESVACSLCGSDRAQPVVAAADWYLNGDPTVCFQVVRCLGCGLHFQCPRPSPETLKGFYPTQYYSYRQVEAIPVHGLRAISRRLEWWVRLGLRRAFFGYPAAGGRLQRAALRLILWPLWVRLQLLGKDLKIVPYRGRGRFLDVGCGTGRELAFQRQCGLTVAGVELNPEAAASGRKYYGIDIRPGTLEQAGFVDGAFDVVHMSHVFEHVPDPGATLDEMHRILGADGLAILKVPNIASVTAGRFGPFWHGLDLPRHLYHFDPKTITELLHRHGFAVERIRQDVGAWGLRRESRRFEVRQAHGHEPTHRWWQDWVDRLAEMVACSRGRGGVIAVYARKVTDASRRTGHG